MELNSTSLNHSHRNNWDLKVVGFIQEVLHQGTNPIMGIPMILAAPIGAVAEVAVLRGVLAKQGATWFSRGIFLKALPGAAALGTEVVAFALGARSLTHLLRGPVPWDPSSVLKDVAMVGLTLGLMKGAGFMGNQGVRWARGLDKVPVSLWTQVDHQAIYWGSQLSSYLGLVSSHGLQNHGGENIWVDALGTQIALGWGTMAGRRALGKGFAAFEQSLKGQADRLYEQTKPQWNRLAAPWTMAAAGPPSSARDNLFFSKSIRPSRAPSHRKVGKNPDVLVRRRDKQSVLKGLEALKQKIQGPPFEKEDCLAVMEKMDWLEQAARDLQNQELRQKVNDFFHDGFAKHFLSSISSEEINGLIAELAPLNSGNVPTWGNTYNLFKAVISYHPLKATQELASFALIRLIIKLDRSGLRVLEHLVKADSLHSRFALHLLLETNRAHHLEDVRKNAQDRSNRLNTSMNLSRYYRP